MGNWGVKVSKVGKDISSTTPEDFVFSTKNDTNVKIVIRNSGTVTVAGSGYTDVTITHSLNFIPVTMLFIEKVPSSGLWFLGGFQADGAGVYVDDDTSTTYVDATYFKFRVYNNTSSQKVASYYYFIFGDSAS